MTTWQLVWAELRGRPMSFVLGMAAVFTAASLLLSGPAMLQGYSQETTRQLDELQTEVDQEVARLDSETRRIMRDLGVNLRIVHEDTNMGSLYADYRAVDFPEEYVQILANAESIQTIVHLVATIQQKMTWNDRTILLVGMLPVMTTSQKNEEKPHMVREVERGTVIVGHELGIGRRVGGELEIEGHSFRIVDIRPDMGTEENIQLVVHLHDAQEVLDMPGRIHQIMALNCKCKGDRLSVIRRELEGVLPMTRVTEHTSRATARERQRDEVAASGERQVALLRENRLESEAGLERLLAIVLPIVVLVSAAFVGIVAWWNVRDRQVEIGLLRALGKTSRSVFALILGKAVVMGLLAGALACVVWLATVAVCQAGGVETEGYWPAPWMFAAALLGAPLIAALGSYLPALLAVSRDPASILTEA